MTSKKNAKNKSKRIIISIVIFCALAVGAYWMASKDERDVNKEIEHIEQQIAEIRAGERGYYQFQTWIYSEERKSEKFEEFLVTQIEEICRNEEIALLDAFLEELENDEYYSEEVRNAASAIQCSNVENTLSLLKLFGKHSSDGFYELHFEINRNSDAIASYIKDNGVNQISYTPGEGYYADKSDSSQYNTVGIAGSPLYDSSGTKYLGDFKRLRTSGVKLNSLYEEESYSSAYYSFRGERIKFFDDESSAWQPVEGECVWSGDYLFCFSSTGELIGYADLG